MLKLKEFQQCPKTNICQYSSTCHGSFLGRPSVFECNFVDEKGNIRENCSRVTTNTTGKFEILCE